MPKSADPFKPEHFLNRELSWLEFNQRVLDEALNPATPLLERVKFFCITSTNLDEFFEIRVAGVKQQIESGATERSIDGLRPAGLLRQLHRRIRRMVEDQYACWREELVPALAKTGIHFPLIPDLSPDLQAWVEQFYRSEVRQTLTPLVIDQAHPFPHLLNKSLNIIVELERNDSPGGERHLAVVQVPRVLPRLITIPTEDGTITHVFLGHLIGYFLADLFPGMKILGHWVFRVTRNSELYIDEEEVANLLKAVEKELHNRRKGDAVRLELAPDCPPAIRQFVLNTLGLSEEDLYIINGPLNPARLMSLCDHDQDPELRDPPFIAPVAGSLRAVENIFDSIRQGDILLHHPYENFSSVVTFLEQAAEDSQVLAIKQTLYRTGGDERIVGALMRAVKNGKQVTAVVELRARFDEANNIQWARKLEEAGVHVVYGLVGFKIHSKITLVVRRDEDGIRRYLHLGTGNYNPSTARLYTDLSLFTAHPDFGEDATNLFNLLTGICQFPGMRKLLVAPYTLHPKIIALIERETANARMKLPARIIAKMNALVDGDVIHALYRASQAGVQIDLIVRGICCLKPGIPGISERIRVRSIVDRFLEHSRIFYFENACQPEIFVGSADWMPRNFFRRIEVVFPIEDGRLRERIMQEVLLLPLADNVKARLLNSDGTYAIPPLPPKATAVRSQAEFIRVVQNPATRRVKNGRSPRSSAEIQFPKMELVPNPHKTKTGSPRR